MPKLKWASPNHVARGQYVARDTRSAVRHHLGNRSRLRGLHAGFHHPAHRLSSRRCRRKAAVSGPRQQRESHHLDVRLLVDGSADADCYGLKRD